MTNAEGVTSGTSLGATVPTNIGHTNGSSLIDTGAMRSGIIDAYYHKLMLPNLKHLFNVTVRSASGNNLQPMGLVTLGQNLYIYSL